MIGSGAGWQATSWSARTSSPTTGSDATRTVSRRAELDAIVGAWCAGHDLAEIRQRADAAGIGNARLNSVCDLAEHPQLSLRDWWQDIGTPVGPMPALIPPAMGRH